MLIIIETINDFEHVIKRFSISELFKTVVSSNKIMKTVCVIGAGTAGLTAIKQAINFGCEVTAFEQSDKIGGTWVFDEKTGKDKHGIDIHSSMYEGLYTNLPKEVMGAPDFPIPPQNKSYISSQEMLKFLNLYADKFLLRNKIKFEHHVIRVRPLVDDSWEVIVTDLNLNSYETLNFDAVLVCNGHYHTPLIPKYKGSEIYNGKQIHSHDYRNAAKFKGESVLIIGGKN